MIKPIPVQLRKYYIMKKLLFIILFPAISFAQTLEVQAPIRILALGDSYTIGQSVPAAQRWPVQLKDSLTVRGFTTDTMRIIATTGWRTDNLINAITNQHLEQQHYNLVSLLIGVNNQYQGTPFSQYVNQFPQLLDSAIRYAGGDTSHVFVVSIPDYAYTPYGQSTGNQAQISQQLDQYNAYNRHIADSFHIKYFDITPISRQGIAQPNLVANDGLHPSAIQYSKWVKLMLNHIDSSLIVTSVAKTGFEEKISVYPNPTHDNIKVSYNKTGVKTVELYDATGRLILRKEMIDNIISVSLKDINKGIYMIRITSGNESFSRKIIKE